MPARWYRFDQTVDRRSAEKAAIEILTILRPMIMEALPSLNVREQTSGARCRQSSPTSVAHTAHVFAMAREVMGSLHPVSSTTLVIFGECSDHWLPSTAPAALPPGQRHSV